MKKIPLSQGKFALVDDDDFEWLSQYKWYFHDGYAERNQKPRFMSRLILDAPAFMQVDHKNGNPLDNRRENLRLATPAENCRNRKQQSNNTTGERGVYWHKQLGKWAVRVRRDGKLVNGGIFKTFESAVVAARILRELLHAEFSGLSRDK